VVGALEHRPNPALEPTAASGLRRLAVPSALRASAAAQRERYAAPNVDHRLGHSLQPTRKHRGGDAHVAG
jgi:hypothetical protein